jgi:hypothetical protein
MKMDPGRLASTFVDTSNVVDFGQYRRARQLSKFRQQFILRPAQSRHADGWVHDDYRARMKVNAFVFVFLVFLVTTGIWLVDGLSDSFATKRSYQHRQNYDAGPGAVARLTNGIRARL